VSKGRDFLNFRIFALIGLLALIPPLLPAINESPIHAEVIISCQIFSNKSLRKAVASLTAGEMVEILEDFSEKVYKVAMTDGTKGWIDARNIKIPPDIPTDKSVLPPAILEEFVNAKDYASKTNYLILVDIGRQKTHVFNNSANYWQLQKSFDCSTGQNTSPTTRGIFTFTDRGEWFYSHRLQSGAKYWIRFNGNYLFHSIPMDKNKKPLAGEDVVGTKLSNGCVRLTLPNIKWIYDNIPDGTTVVIL